MLHSHSVALAWYGLTLLVPISQNGQTHQTIRRKLPTNCLSVFDHFVGLALEGLNVDLTLILLPILGQFLYCVPSFVLTAYCPFIENSLHIFYIHLNN